MNPSRNHKSQAVKILVAVIIVGLIVAGLYFGGATLMQMISAHMGM